MLHASRRRYKSADREAVNQIDRIVPVNPTDRIAISVLKVCATNGKAVEAVEIRKHSTIIVTFAKIMFPHYMSEQGCYQSPTWLSDHSSRS